MSGQTDIAGMLALVDAAYARMGDYQSKPDVTPLSHPDHHTVGKDFMGASVKHMRSARWFCASHDQSGYNMVNRADPENVVNVSERAIGRTFHEIYVSEAIGSLPALERSLWGPCLIGKDGRDRPSPTPEEQHSKKEGIDA